MSHGKGRGRTSVAIIGGGLSGICTAIDLIRQRKCDDFVILERGVQVGGTWHDNTYPGCCCDVWSHLYSLSFEPNPGWTREYPEQSEILAYIIGVAEKWGLYKHIRFNSEVEEARWNDDDKAWDIKVKVAGGKEAEYGDEYTLRADFLVSGVGQLNKPYYPDLLGLKEFSGKVMHSARWDWSFPLEGKRIGIIGNGATAAQIIPEVTNVCKSLVVFQRTPNWVTPRGDTTISPTRRWMYTYVPGSRSRYRAQLMETREAFYNAAQVEDTPEKEGIRKDCLDLMARQIPTDSKLRAKLIPNYPPGCKRVIVSDDFYPALNKEHVELETVPIDKFTTKGITMTNGEHHDFDVVILATGFRTQDFLYPIKVYGRGGRELSEVWQGHPRAYLGMAVQDMPNFAMLYGPNTNLGHNSIILMIEAQSRYISALVKPILELAERGSKISMVPKLAVLERWNQDIQARLQQGTVGNPACNSWYKTDDGVVTNNWCGTVVEYQDILSSVGWDDYEIGYWRVVDGVKTVRWEEKEAALAGRTYIGRVREEMSLALKIVERSALVGVAAAVAWRVYKAAL